MVFDTLSPEDQQAIREAAAEAGELNRELSQKADQELPAQIEAAGVEINEVDTAPFIEKTKPVYEEWQAQFPELVDLVQKEAAAAAGQ